MVKNKTLVELCTLYGEGKVSDLEVKDWSKNNKVFNVIWGEDDWDDDIVWSISDGNSWAEVQWDVLNQGKISRDLYAKVYKLVDQPDVH